MKLYHSPTSPFVRKVMMMAIETGQDSKLELVPTATAEMAPAFVAANPLARVPALETDDGMTIPESTLICAYLDDQHGGARMIPRSGEARWRALKQEALATGFMEAAVAARGEMTRAEGERSPVNIDKLKARMTRALAALEAEADSFGGPITIGQLATAAALGYADFRYGDLGWRGTYPKLAAWYQRFSERPSVQRTQPPK